MTTIMKTTDGNGVGWAQLGVVHGLDQSRGQPTLDQIGPD